MKTVLHLNASSAGGAFVAARRLSEALNKTGQVSSSHLVFTGHPGPHYTVWANNAAKKARAFVLHALEKLDFLRYEKNRSLRFAFSHGLTGINITRSEAFREADIIHLHWINKGFISLNGLESILDSGKKVVWTCHDMWPFTGGCYHTRGCDHYHVSCGNCPYLKNPSEHDLSHKVFEKKKRIFGYRHIQWVTPSAWLADQAGKSAIHPKIKIHVIPNSIDVLKFDIKNKAAAKKKLGFDASKKLLLFAAANLDNQFKGFPNFIETIAELNKICNLDIEVAVIGKTKVPEHAGMRYCGVVQDADKMRDYYSAADVYVTTSLEENLPTTIMESLACGTPVAAFRVGGIPEMIEHGITGVLADKFDSKQLAIGMKELLNTSENEYESMRQRCHQKAQSEYAEGVVVKKYLELYYRD